MRALKYSLVVALIGLVAGGCYPDESQDEALELDGMSLPLSEVGISVEPIALQSWLTWAQDGFEGEPFDMGTPGNDFAFYLRLFDADRVPVSFQGRSISLADQDGQEHLLVDLEVDPCVDCRFDLALFWRDIDAQGQPVRVFYGQSDLFTAQHEGDLPDGLGATLTERATGRVRVVAGDGDVADLDGAWVAARDPVANVRLPHTVVRADDNVPAILTGVPLERDMTIELDPLADGRFYAPFAAILLTDPEGEVSLP